jgi:hypothetical protein
MLRIKKEKCLFKSYEKIFLLSFYILLVCLWVMIEGRFLFISCLSKNDATFKIIIELKLNNNIFQI